MLTITTWENGARGAHVQRVYEMEDQEGRLRVSIKSDWILIDPVTRKILRPALYRKAYRNVSQGDRLSGAPQDCSAS